MDRAGLSKQMASLLCVSMMRVFQKYDSLAPLNDAQELQKYRNHNDISSLMTTQEND